MQAYFKHIGDESWAVFGTKRTMNFASSSVQVGLAVTSQDNSKIFNLTMTRKCKEVECEGVQIVHYIKLLGIIS